MAAQTIAAGDYDRSSAEAMVAKIAVDRTEKLFKDRAGSQRAIDDARGLLQVALSVQRAAEQRKNQLTEVLETLNVKVKNGTADAIPLTAPQSGIIRTVFVSEGQAVTSGTQLFEILDFSSMWIRVPVFVDQLNSIVADAPARITGLDGTLARLGSSGPGTQEFFATPIAAPPSADAIGTTADLYFAIDNTVLGLRPGQRVGVHLQTSKASVAIIVPYASIVYDIHGDTWIYRSPEKNKFVRQRVDIRFVDGPRAVLHSGPKVGDSIVVDGVAELFGTENALNGVPFVKTIRSKSVLGLSSVRLIFQPNTDLLIARQLVQERLATVAATLPMIARPPTILPPLSSLSRCMKIGLWSDIATQMDMTVLTKWTIRPRLMSVAGVANVAVWGEKDPQLQIVVNPDRLRAHGVTVDMVLQAARDATAVGSGGFIDTANQRIAIRNVPPVYSPEQLGQTVVAFRRGAPLRIADVANVIIDHAPPIGDAVINSRPGLLLIVEKQPWANTLDVTRGVEKAMRELKPAMGVVEFDTTIFRPATFIEKSIANLSYSMWLGCVLVIVVLIAFLFDWRSAVISATAIPLSLIAAVMVLYYRGGTVNTMVLAGLVIALGEVVDDAIIDVENIMRRLRLNQQLAEPRSAFQVVLSASMEVRSAVVYATIIVILAFLPVFFLDGLAGSFFKPLASSYILAILASLVVALTLTPALSLMLLPAAAKLRHREGPLVAALKLVYRCILPVLIRFPKSTLAATAACFIVIGCTMPWLGEELMPKFKETDFLMHWVEKPSGAQVSLETVANVIIVPAPNEIKREGASRRLDVTCNAVDRDLGSVALDIEKAVLANIKFPTGYHPEFLGEYVEARASRQRIILLSIASVIAIGLILYVDFRSWRVVGLMIMTLPLALLGGVLGVHVTGGIISLGSLVGFVTVLGIAARNAIMLISHYRHLIHEEGEPWGPGLLMRGAEERLAPILMTVLAAGLSLLPLVISGKLPGQEIEFPMAWVILLGLASATLVNLFVLPVGCAMFLKQIPASESEREALAPG